jgi:hypothetical protein
MTQEQRNLSKRERSTSLQDSKKDICNTKFGEPNIRRSRLKKTINQDSRTEKSVRERRKHQPPRKKNGRRHVPLELRMAQFELTSIGRQMRPEGSSDCRKNTGTPGSKKGTCNSKFGQPNNRRSRLKKTLEHDSRTEKPVQERKKHQPRLKCAKEADCKAPARRKRLVLKCAKRPAAKRLLEESASF